MEVPGPDSDWRSPAFRQKVVAQIEEAMRKAGTAHTKSSNDMENHVYVKAKSREEYLSLVARLIIHFRDIHKKAQGGGPDPMNALTNLPGVPGVPGGIGMGPRPPGAPMGGMGQMQMGQHAMAGVAGNPQSIGGPGQMQMQQIAQHPCRLPRPKPSVGRRWASVWCQPLPKERSQKHDLQTPTAPRQALCDCTAQYLGPECQTSLSFCSVDKTHLTSSSNLCWRQHNLSQTVQTERGGLPHSGTPALPYHN
uniref:Mediator of RNA polymerase II transcription subunit 15 n=1 Tax=Salmo salar TaxID=8030 RepID=B5X8K3_SALSA|nr:Mediator of RNA polymerase II transcription subunit 15 [Salmo salar]